MGQRDEVVGPDVEAVDRAMPARDRTPPQWLVGVLGAHLALLAVLVVASGIPLVPAAAVVIAVAALTAAAALAPSPWLASGSVALGLTVASWLVVIWTGGASGTPLHGLVVIALLATTRDVRLLLVAVVGLLALHLGVGLVAPEVVYGVTSGPLAAVGVHVAAVLATAAAVLLWWRQTDRVEGDRLHAAERASAVMAHHERQAELAATYSTVARRSQGLLERQLEVIEQLEADEEDPAALDRLFSLDHLTALLSREAASLLVLAGGTPRRRVNGRPPLSEVARGAIGGIEDYTRVDVQLDGDRDVDGQAVAPLVHLLSELMENAAAYSPPDSRVRVHGTTTADSGFRLQVIDRGIGLDDFRIAEYNDLLAHPSRTIPVDTQRVGLHVVARLAGTLGVGVELAHNTDGPGVTASIHLPAPLLGPATEEQLSRAADVHAIPVPVMAPADPVEVRRRPGSVPARPRAVQPDPPVRESRRTVVPQPATAAGPAEPASAPVAEPVQAVAAQVAAEPTRGVARSGAAWSYSGHLDRREAAERAAQPDGSADAPRRFGRGSGSQIRAVAPRSVAEDVVGSHPVPTAVVKPVARPADATSAAGGSGPHPGPRWTAATRQPAQSPHASGGAPSMASEMLAGVGDGPPTRSWTDPQVAGAPGDGGSATPGGGPSPSGDGTAHAGRPDVAPAPAPLQPDPLRSSTSAAERDPDAPLPSRQRGASLPPGLRAGAAPPQRSASAAPVSREESKSLLSSYQTRLQAGRRAAEEQVARTRSTAPGGRAAAAGEEGAGTADDEQAGSAETS
jgi:signal transduction histidine kinase